MTGTMIFDGKTLAVWEDEGLVNVLFYYNGVEITMEKKTWAAVRKELRKL